MDKGMTKTKTKIKRSKHGTYIYSTSDGFGTESGAITTLDRLLEVLRLSHEVSVNAFDRQADSWFGLPVFSANAPPSASQDIWSWDADRLLVTSTAGSFELVDRDSEAYRS